MAYDEELADRIREAIGDAASITEARMFGGLAFLCSGHTAICASGQGGILVRVVPDETDRLIESTAAVPMVMRGGEVRGWVRVAADDVRTKRQLDPWVRRGLAYASSLPPKKPRRRR